MKLLTRINVPGCPSLTDSEVNRKVDMIKFIIQLRKKVKNDSIDKVTRE